MKKTIGQIFCDRVPSLIFLSFFRAGELQTALEDAFEIYAASSYDQEYCPSNQFQQ
jgi:hypothetical protein